MCPGPGPGVAGPAREDVMARGAGGARGQPRRQSGSLESEVLGVLWSAEGPLTAAAVHAALGEDLAYKTVLTVLVRLHDKGVVDRARAGRAHAYRPVQDRSQAAAQSMSAALDQAGDTGEAMMAFVSRLGPAAQAALRAALDQARQ